jgi:hypothetical protein
MMLTAFRRLGWAVLVLALAAPTTTWARVAKIETTAPLQDHSDRAIERALRAAVDTCVSGATAMGLSWIRLDDALVLADRVVVRMIASDEDMEDDVQEIDPAPRLAPI